MEAQRRAGQRQGTEQRPKYRKRKRPKLNVGLLLFAVVILLVVGISFIWITKNPAPPAETEDLLGSLQEMGQNGSVNIPVETSSPGTTDETEGETEIPGIPYVGLNVNSADIHLGDLILVNYQYAYPFADTVETVEIYSSKTSYNVSNMQHRLTGQALDAMNRMADAFTAETGLAELLVVSSYRNTADQQSVYDSKVASNGEEYAKNYVAVPGYSEHHTGMALDLSFYRVSTGATIPVAEHENGGWLSENCTTYGFILRYPESKADITRIAYEPWHFRYVGTPHAAVITKTNLCLEEYIGLLKDYTFEGKLLHALSDGTTAEVTAATLPAEGYVVYYVPASADETTEIPLPEGYGDHSVSGNNADGFLVTVSMVRG